MFGAMDAGVAVLSALMLALGAVPALLALSSRRARAPLFELRQPVVPAPRFVFGAATAARYAGVRGS